MSHKPIEAEINAAFDVWHDPHLGTMTHALTAANTLRDRRIRNEALEEAIRALENFGYENGKQECCGHGVPTRANDGEECCGNPVLVITLDLAAADIRALKDKEPNHE